MFKFEFRGVVVGRCLKLWLREIGVRGEENYL